MNFDFNLNIPEHKPVIADILETDVDEKYTLSNKLWEYLQNYAEKHRQAGNGFGYGIASPEGVARTLSARYYKDGSEILIEQPGKNPRRLTPRECARLQGFPTVFPSRFPTHKPTGSLVTQLWSLLLEQLLPL